jgi:NADPH:quinone reductase-like Zn-dependent oxidoreductase
MRAVVLKGDASSRRLVVADVASPTPGSGDLLVGVRVSALNQADLRMAASHFAASEGRGGPAVAGLELAGEVLEVGADVAGFEIGDRVMGMSGGAWAERAVVDHRLAIPVPDALSWDQAGACPISYVVAHDALSAAAGLRPGQSVLVQGATSAAGLACVQMARFLGAGTIFGTTGSAEKLERLRGVGCDVAIDRSSEDVAGVVAAGTGGRGVDVVIDVVGAGAVQENIDAAVVRGRIVCLGRLAGRDVSFDIDEFSRKRITMVGVTFRTRTMAERVAVMARFNAEVASALGSESLLPVVDRSFPLDEIESALDYLRQSTRMGKVVLDVGLPA